MNDRCDRIREKLEDELSRRLSAEDRADVDRHVEGCENCRRYRDALHSDDRLLDAFAASVDGLASRIEDGVMRAPDTTAGSHEAGTRLRFAHPALRFAAAIAVIAAIAVFSHVLNRGGASDVVWARVFRQVEESSGFTARGVVENNSGRYDFVIYESDRYGQKHTLRRQGTRVSDTFMDFARGLITVIQYGDSTYIQYDFGPAGPRDVSIYQVVSRMKERDHTSLGTKEIDGIKTSGIAVTDTFRFGGRQMIQTERVYVDVETQWPVSIEVVSEFGSGEPLSRLELRGFEWHKVFGPGDFEPVIPEGFRRVNSSRPGGG